MPRARRTPTSTSSGSIRRTRTPRRSRDALRQRAGGRRMPSRRIACTPTFVPNDPLLRRAAVEPAADRHGAGLGHPAAAGSSITVAVLDTGVAYRTRRSRRTSARFTDDDGVNVSRARRVQTIPYRRGAGPGRRRRFGPHRRAARLHLERRRSPLDFDGHGTHVGGTIGQLTNDGVGTAGVAFNVKLMPVKVLASDWDVHLRLARRRRHRRRCRARASATRPTTARRSST